MKPIVLSLSMVVTSLTGQADAAALGNPMVTIPRGSLSTQVQSSGQQLFHGIGVVTGLDMRGGMVTIAGEAIPGLMDAMEMDYKLARKSLAAGVEVGDRVSFELDGHNYTIFALSKDANGH